MRKFTSDDWTVFGISVLVVVIVLSWAASLPTPV